MAIRRSLHSNDYTTFLRLLKQVREDAGLTQADLAKRIKQTQTYVSKSERGERRVDLIEMRLICNALKLDFGSFIGKLDVALKAPRR